MTMEDHGDLDNEATQQQVVPPSFAGRLELSTFMYTSSETSSSLVRRSSRLAHTAPTGQSGVSSPSLSPSQAATPSPISGASSSNSTKRKHSHNTSKPTSQTTSTPTSPGSSSPHKKKKRTRSTYAPPSTYAHLSHLPDALAPNLLILFCGLNPGVQTARTGHAYSHPTNLFWRLLYTSGITPERCQASEDRSLPARYALGLTNIVARPSRNGAELSRAEMDEGVAVLEGKCRRWRPEVICVVGKSIWESIWRVRKGRGLRKGDFRYGWQDESENMGVVAVEESEDGLGWRGARVFVATSTSGLAATLRPEEKEIIWKELGDWCVSRRRERLKEAEKTGAKETAVQGSDTKGPEVDEDGAGL